MRLRVQSSGRRGHLASQSPLTRVSWLCSLSERLGASRSARPWLYLMKFAATRTAIFTCAPPKAARSHLMSARGLRAAKRVQKRQEGVMGRCAWSIAPRHREIESRSGRTTVVVAWLSRSLAISCCLVQDQLPYLDAESSKSEMAPSEESACDLLSSRARSSASSQASCRRRSHRRRRPGRRTTGPPPANHGRRKVWFVVDEEDQGRRVDDRPRIDVERQYPDHKIRAGGSRGAPRWSVVEQFELGRQGRPLAGARPLRSEGRRTSAHDRSSSLLLASVSNADDAFDLDQAQPRVRRDHGLCVVVGLEEAGDRGVRHRRRICDAPASRP